MLHTFYPNWSMLVLDVDGKRRTLETSDDDDIRDTDVEALNSGTVDGK